VEDPPGADTVIGPVAAPGGTRVRMVVGVDEITGAWTPVLVPGRVNVTRFRLGVGLNSVPKILTGSPTGPRAGLNSTMETTARPSTR
jgi:hypothetical protein